MDNYSQITVLYGNTFDPKKVALREINLEDILNKIFYPSSKNIELFKKIRNTNDKSQRSYLKRNLNGVLYNLNTQTWKSTSEVQKLFESNKKCINPLIMIDIDHQDILMNSFDIQQIKKNIFYSLEYVITAFISPSGSGIKVLCYLDPFYTHLIDINTYNDVSRKIHFQIQKDINDLQPNYSIELDLSCANIVKSHYISYDEDKLIRKFKELKALNIQECIINAVKEKLNKKKIKVSKVLKVDDQYLNYSLVLVERMPLQFKETQTKYKKFNTHEARLNFSWALLYLTNNYCLEHMISKYSDKKAGLQSFSASKWEKSLHTTWFLLTEIAKQQDDVGFFESVKLFKSLYKKKSINT